MTDPIAITHEPIALPRKRERPPAPFAELPRIAATWADLRLELSETLQAMDKLETELEQLRHSKLVNEITLDGGVTISFERLPREELVQAKLTEVCDVKDRLDRAQRQINDKLAAMSARNVGPPREHPPRPPKPPGNPMPEKVLARMEADLVTLAKGGKPAKPAPPERRGWFGRR